MTNDHQPPSSEPSGPGRAIEIYIGTIVALAVVAAGLVAFVEATAGHGDVNWLLFGVFASVLLVTETQSSTWMRFGDGGIVTPSWTFTFALMLLGSPTGAIAAMVVTTIIADLMARKEPLKVIFNTSQIALSLAIGGLILFAFDIHGPLFAGETLPTSWAIGMILSGIVVFGTNGMLICRLLATLERTSFWAMMRDSFALSMSADAAMLAMAPILVITTKNSLLMLPLIGTATFFVYQTAQHAIQRSHEANHDPLTQILNRRAFTGELDDFVQNASADGKTGSVLILDLDRFKEVNDRLGHRTGDLVLQAFSNRLNAALPESAIVARLGGDEFAVLLPGLDADAATAVAKRLHRTLDEPLIVDDFPISAGTSIGAAHFPQHGLMPSDLMHAADVAMYRAKQFRSGVEIYEGLGAAQQKGRVTLLADVADALARNEFFLEYQPQVHLATGRIEGVEALLRWNHPVHGRIQPDEFIGLAEHTDLIGPITRHVIETAVTEISRLGLGIGVAVNVSARNLQDRHFASETLSFLSGVAFPPHLLEMEITESAIALEPERTTVVLAQLRSAGVRISIDDFGTGYSSFSTLRGLTVDRLKIDRSFISDLPTSDRDHQIVRSVVDLAHGLGLDVVAEGVETANVWMALDAIGCDIAQGYLISEPISIDELPRRLQIESTTSESATATEGVPT